MTIKTRSRQTGGGTVAELLFIYPDLQAAVNGGGNKRQDRKTDWAWCGLFKPQGPPTVTSFIRPYPFQQGHTS